MGFLIGLFTVILVLDCGVLTLLVLIQLPKKDAGAGLAFGGGATDALFGAGSGNVLTKITKYAATIFFVLAIVLSMMQRNYHTRTTSVFEQKLGQTSAAPLLPSTTPQPTTTKPAAVPTTNATLVTPPRVEDTNLSLAIPPSPAPTAAPKK
jgi:preprotein translocase subunit SecG